MAAIQTVDGHVARALDFYNHDDIWFVIARPFDWDVARLTGSNQGPFIVPVAETLEFVVNGFTVSYTLSVVSSPGDTAATIASEINTIAAGVDASLSTMASAVDDRIQLTAPPPGVGLASIEITQASPILGFIVGEISEATSGATVPAPGPLTKKVNEAIGYKKVSIKDMVVPDASTPAEIFSLQGNTFDTSIANNSNVLVFEIDGFVTPISVTFPDSASTPLSGGSGSVVDTINAAASAVSLDFANVASVDPTVSPPRLKLTSPTLGSSSTLNITTGNPSPFGAGGLGIDVQAVSGIDGGSIRYRLDQFRPVALGDIFDEGARLVHILAEILYDELPLQPFTQIGVMTGLVPITGLETREYLLPDEVQDVGVLEFLDHRQLTPRSIDQKEILELIVEF